MASGEAVARVCTIAETFGVVDVAARAMGMHSYTWCTGETAALQEVGAQPFHNRERWGEWIRDRRTHPYVSGDATYNRDVNDFRASRVLPKWLELLQ